MSKFSREVMNRAVYGPLSQQAEDPSVVMGSVFGEDIALVRGGGGRLMASHVDPIVGAAAGLGKLAVHVACNDLAAGGVRPRWIQLLVLVPGRDDGDSLKRIMEEAVSAAGEIGAVIVGGHSGYTSALSRPLAAVTAFGDADLGSVVSSFGARAGDRICVTRGIGLEGTSILAWDYGDLCLKRGLSPDEISGARALSETISVVSEAMTLAGIGATSMHDPTRGGVLEALMEMARGSGTSFRIERERLPVSPVVASFAEAFDFDPMRMISSGALVVTLPEEKVELAMSELAGIAPLYPVGVVERGSGVVIAGEADVRYGDPEPETDELARLQELLGPPVSPERQ